MYSSALSDNSSKTRNASDKEFWGKICWLRNVRQILWDVKTRRKFSMTGLTSETVLNKQTNTNPCILREKVSVIQLSKCKGKKLTGDQVSMTYPVKICVQSKLGRGLSSRKRKQSVNKVMKTVEHIEKADNPCWGCRVWLRTWWSLYTWNRAVREETCPR